MQSRMEKKKNLYFKSSSSWCNCMNLSPRMTCFLLLVIKFHSLIGPPHIPSQTFPFQAECHNLLSRCTGLSIALCTFSRQAEAKPGEGLCSFRLFSLSFLIPTPRTLHALRTPFTTSEHTLLYQESLKVIYL